VLLLGLGLGTGLGPVAASASASASAGTKPVVAVSPKKAGAGHDITVSGSGWQPGTLLTLLICGQNAIGGTNSCANSSGRAATTDAKGAFSRTMPVAEPPKPCPCVVHVATVLGESVTVDAPFVVSGHPVAPLPTRTTGGRLTLLAAHLEGSSGLLTWFGAPPQRTLVITVGNLGSDPAENPVFRVGSSHGVFAPEWDDQPWHGTVQPGGKQQIKLPVELASGAHGEYTVSLEYGGKTLATEPWSVGHPWGVTLFWLLLCVVVPSALFRIGMAAVNRLRPGGAEPEARALPSALPATAAPALPWFTQGVPSQPPTPSDDVERENRVERATRVQRKEPSS
jgi:hypothetical protein